MRPISTTAGRLVVAGALVAAVGCIGTGGAAAGQAATVPGPSVVQDHREQTVGATRIATRCRDAYQGKLQKLVQRRAREAVYFEAHRQAMEATVLGLDQLLADPNAHDAIPFHQRAAAQAKGRGGAESAFIGVPPNKNPAPLAGRGVWESTA